MINVSYIALGMMAIAGFGVSCKRKASLENANTVSHSHGDTARILRETIVPIIDWPEQPLAERLSLIEREAANIGIPIKISEALRMRMRDRPMIYPELRIREVPLSTAIQYTCDSTVLWCTVTDSGSLLFRLMEEGSSDDRGHQKNYSRSPDPFDIQSEQAVSSDGDKRSN